MNVFDKLRAIRDVIQQDVGNRGLARDPKDNLITACPDDFANACRSIAEHPRPTVHVVTGFFIPTATPPAFETDGPLGAVFLARAFHCLKIPVLLLSEPSCTRAINAGLAASEIHPEWVIPDTPGPGSLYGPWVLSGETSGA